MKRPERSKEANTLSPENVDDFKLVRGIGSAIERHLHDAGIHTFLQLAAQTPEGIADLLSEFAGLTPKRITDMDWVGQARSLSAEREYAQPDLVVPSKEGRKRYSTFTVELLLDDQNNIRRTRVVHVQTGQESAWAGWKSARLEKTMLEGINAPPAADTSEAIRRAQIEEASPSGVAAPITGQWRIMDLRVLKAENGIVTRALPHGQPYVLQAALDFTNITAANLPLRYEATVYGRDIGSSRRAIIGVTSGPVQQLPSPMIYMRGKDLERGMYRLELVVVLSLLSGEALQEPLKALMEGSLLQVY